MKNNILVASWRLFGNSSLCPPFAIFQKNVERIERAYEFESFEKKKNKRMTGRGGGVGGNSNTWLSQGDLTTTPHIPYKQHSIIEVT